MTLNRILQMIGGLTIAALLTIAYTPLANVVARNLATDDALAPADAIVVLGAGIQEDGQLSNPSLRRAIRGIEIYRMGFAPLILMLGPDRNIPGNPSEAVARARLAETFGVDSAAILTEERGLNTRLEAEFARERLRPLGVQTLLLVTESQHLLRAKPLFENAGFQVRAVAANDYSTDAGGPSRRMDLAATVVSEQIARIYYRLAGHL